MIAIWGLERESTGFPLCRLQQWARPRLFAIICGLFASSLWQIFLTLPRWIGKYLCWMDYCHYHLMLLTRADRTWSCWAQLFGSSHRLSNERQTKCLRLKSSRVWGMIRSRLQCRLGLQSWLGSNTLFRTPWQRNKMERRWFCRYIGHLPSGSSNRLALLHNATFCHPYQLWHLTLTNINSDIYLWHQLFVWLY